MTLLQDLIHIPERINKGDFVLNLADAVHQPQHTLAAYVVTPQLARCFAEAVGLIRDAVSEGRSKATYLHGSFGSGKSHFMAVLDLLLAGRAEALALPEFAELASRYADWLRASRLLVVPYHMLDASSLESRILGGYVDFVARNFPAAPVPAVYRAAGLLEDAANLRAKMGDAAFFAGLGSSASGGLDWGQAASTWDEASFAAAAAGQPGQPDHDALISALCTAYFPQYQVVMGREQVYLELDSGLAVVTRHAQALGFHGLVLFLDELVLWLMSHRANSAFVAAELNKLAKLVESSQARAIPIVSFVARQRDLSELVGGHLPGVEQTSLAEQLNWWSGRFHTLTLEDRNLPMIAERRVLRPRDHAAALALRGAFESLALRTEVVDILLGSQGEREQFRRIYPFTPALLQALVALSAVLQRERTALKILFQLLVNRRQTLALGELVPMGDLYDALAEEAVPFSEEMGRHYDQAKRLFSHKLLPLIRDDHRVGADEELPLASADPRRQAFEGDLLIAKTLLLSALTPELECFRGLDPARLAALNPGAIHSPVPRRENRVVLQKLRQWATSIGEIRIGDGEQPSVSLQLSGIDTDVILDKARIHDSEGARIQLLRQIIFKALHVQGGDELHPTLELIWRGSTRRFAVSFQNVRTMAESNLRNRDGEWLLVIDYPFDSENYGPADDVALLDRARANGLCAQTLVWLPCFFGPELQRNLGELVRIEHVLASDERLRSHAGHLSEVERGAAKTVLENRRSQLRHKLERNLDSAYGVGDEDKLLQGKPRQHWFVLDDGFQLEQPVGARLAEALAHLVDQLFAQQFPDHPLFPERVRPADLARLLELGRAAVHQPDRRVPYDRTSRDAVRLVGVPLRLCAENDRYFVWQNDWIDHFNRLVDQRGKVTVGDLRAHADLPRPKGLARPILDLLVRLYCEAENFALLRQGRPVQDDARKELDDELVLERSWLPEASAWAGARAVAQRLFGHQAASHPTSHTLRALVEAVVARRDRDLEAVVALDIQLRRAEPGLGPDSPRRRLTAALLALLQRLRDADEPGLIAALASQAGEPELPAQAYLLQHAARLTAALAAVDWDHLQDAWALAGAEGALCAASHAALLEAWADHEQARPLAPALEAAKRAAKEAFNALVRAQREAAASAAKAALSASAPAPHPPSLAKSAEPAIRATGPTPRAPLATPSLPATPAASAPAFERSGQRARLDSAALANLLAELERHAPPGARFVFSLAWQLEES